jgi:hypothetical protein
MTIDHDAAAAPDKFRVPRPAIRFCSDDDLIFHEPNLDEVFPRFDADGNRLRDWDDQITAAMNWLWRNLNSRKSQPEPIELGRIGLRSQEDLREPVAFYAIHLVYYHADTQGGEGDYYDRRSRKRLRDAQDALAAVVAHGLDYDQGNDGTIHDTDKQRPAPPRVIRG